MKLIGAETLKTIVEVAKDLQRRARCIAYGHKPRGRVYFAGEDMGSLCEECDSLFPDVVAWA